VDWLHTFGVDAGAHLAAGPADLKTLSRMIHDLTVVAIDYRPFGPPTNLKCVGHQFQYP